MGVVVLKVLATGKKMRSGQSDDGTDVRLACIPPDLRDQQVNSERRAFVVEILPNFCDLRAVGYYFRRLLEEGQIAYLHTQGLRREPITPNYTETPRIRDCSGELRSSGAIHAG